MQALICTRNWLHGFKEVGPSDVPDVLVKKLNLYVKLEGHQGCVNAVEFNSTGDVIVSVAGDQHHQHCFIRPCVNPDADCSLMCRARYYPKGGSCANPVMCCCDIGVD
ncbi:hypothetical protein P8452_24631 [Trifolium repens]|nr:hypothetical protein P8452_24631 [Trifolium repens]